MPVPTTIKQRLAGLSVFVGMLLTPAFGLAQNSESLPELAPQTSSSPAATASDEGGTATDSDDADRTQREESGLRQAAVYLLIGVVVVGVMMLLFTILLGSRVRRLARSRSGPTPVRDELWYLRSNVKADDDDEPQIPGPESEPPRHE